MRVVLDTNVLVAAAGSSTGASAWLLTQADQGKVSPLATTALLLEYDHRPERPGPAADFRDPGGSHGTGAYSVAI